MTPELPDDEWIRYLKENDHQALQALWLLLHGYRLAAMQQYGVREEVASEAILSTFERIKQKGIYQFRFNGPFRGYCLTIFVRQVRSIQRRSGQLDDDLDEGRIGGQPDPEPPAGLDTVRARLQPCLDQLSTRQREIIDRFYFQGQDPATIATQLGIQRNYVNQLTHRARIDLRRCLEGRGYQGPNDLLF